MTSSGSSLLFVGGGLCHALLLRQVKTQLGDNLQLTLVAPDRFIPFPALLPELVSGELGYREGHIDLQLLCEQAGARLITSTLKSLDLDARCAHLRDGGQLEFDLISLDGGLQLPESSQEESMQSLSLKPLERFLPGWQGVLERLYRHPQGARLALVGDDEISIELMLAISNRLDLEPRLTRPPELHLVHPGRSLLPQLPLKAQLLAAEALQERHIRVHPLFPAVRFEEGQLLTERQQHLPVDEVIWCQSAITDSSATQLGLTSGKQGLIKVNRHLQSVSHPFVFAVGDLSEFDSADKAISRDSSWGLAAHQASVLTANLARSLRGEALKTYKEPKTLLNFIKLGEGQAMVLRRDTVLRGAWVRRWKNFRDRRFISQFPRP